MCFHLLYFHVLNTSNLIGTGSHTESNTLSDTNIFVYILYRKVLMYVLYKNVQLILICKNGSSMSNLA